jgi:hypothetical protein
MCGDQYRMCSMVYKLFNTNKFWILMRHMYITCDSYILCTYINHINDVNLVFWILAYLNLKFWCWEFDLNLKAFLFGIWMLKKFNLIAIIWIIFCFGLCLSLWICCYKGFFFLARCEWMGLLGYDLLDVKCCNW